MSHLVVGVPLELKGLRNRRRIRQRTAEQVRHEQDLLYPPAGSPEPPLGERLDSWKEIAAYLKREVRTAQRWEKNEGLPVRRHQHDKLSTVFAYKSELDAWWHERQPRLEKEVEPPDGSGALDLFVETPGEKRDEALPALPPPVTDPRRSPRAHRSAIRCLGRVLFLREISYRISADFFENTAHRPALSQSEQ
jgi:hypothetical protein